MHCGPLLFSLINSKTKYFLILIGNTLIKLIGFFNVDSVIMK